MAELLWGKVYYLDHFAGILREEPGNSSSFTYDESYLVCDKPAIAHMLPLSITPHKNISGLLPFFDNLVAEGWLEQAQSRLLGRREASRFELLLAFGYDCAGAVSILDPDPEKISAKLLDINDKKELASFTSRASLSGVQAKLAIIKNKNQFCATKTGELSTHIAKFSSATHPDLIYNEYLTTLAFKKLLPEEDTVEIDISEVNNILEPALIITRFDRHQGKRLHFEEFNQLLNKQSKSKYSGEYQEMAKFISETPDCIPTETYRLFCRILAGLLLGNTDMHFKNFAMFHTADGLRLTPSYDQVAANLYQYKTVALGIAGANNLLLGNLKAKNILILADEFKIPAAAINLIVLQLEKNKEAACEAILEAPHGSKKLKDQLINLLEARWKGTFALIGKSLLKKR